MLDHGREVHDAPEHAAAPRLLCKELEERDERSLYATARSRGELGSGGALGVGHRSRRERRHAFYV